jgi:hypothetical protein
MDELKQALERIAGRGEVRGATETWSGAVAAAKRRKRTRRHGARAVGAIAVVALLATVGAVVLRERDNSNVVTTNAAAATITCTIHRGDEATAVRIDPLVVPSSTSADLGDGYRVTVDVYHDDEERKVLRVTLFGPPSEPAVPGYPEGTKGVIEGGFLPDGRRTNLAGTIGAGYIARCANDLPGRENPLATDFVRVTNSRGAVAYINTKAMLRLNPCETLPAFKADLKTQVGIWHAGRGLILDGVDPSSVEDTTRVFIGTPDKGPIPTGAATQTGWVSRPCS